MCIFVSVYKVVKFICSVQLQLTVQTYVGGRNIRVNFNFLVLASAFGLQDQNASKA